MINTDPTITRWRRIGATAGKSWVLFSHDTCVLFDEARGDLAERARALMREWGPVQVGTPAGDFDVVVLEEVPGWLVTCHHPDIVTYVGPDEGLGGAASEIIVGLLGRAKRHQDAQEQAVVHVEDRRLENVGPNAPADCACLETPMSGLLTYREMGMDSSFGEATLLYCRRCGRYWLRYFYENEAFTKSGRWYLGALPPAVLANAGLANARAALEELSWYFYGGSYYDGRWGKTSGKIWLERVGGGRSRNGVMPAVTICGDAGTRGRFLLLPTLQLGLPGPARP